MAVNFIERSLPVSYEETPDARLRMRRIHRRLQVQFLVTRACGHESVGKAHSALSAASLQYFSAVGGLHSLAEAVYFASLALFRLIGSQHMHVLLTVFGFSCRIAQYIIIGKSAFCQEVFRFFYSGAYNIFESVQKYGKSRYKNGRLIASPTEKIGEDLCSAAPKSGRETKRSGKTRSPAINVPL